MNVIGPGAMSNVQKAAITSDVVSLLQDSDIRTSVTLYTPTSSSMDPATGTVSKNETGDAVTGFGGPLTLRDIGIDSPYQIGDKRLCVIASDLTNTPTKDSRWTEGNTRYAVVTVERDSLGIFYELIGRATRS